MKSNPFPSLTQDDRRYAPSPERVGRIFSTATLYAPQTRLTFGRASAVPPLQASKLLISKLVTKDVQRSPLEFCSAAIDWIQVLGG
jgi:hypothetical protein